MYHDAVPLLRRFVSLSDDFEQRVSALFGLLACQIVLKKWSDAMESMDSLKAEIDTISISSPLKTLSYRTSLLHWSLFVFYSHSDGPDALLDLFFTPAYMNTIQTTCPYLLRFDF